MAAPYLSSKTEVLSSQQPVEPAQARAAQIPLQDFRLPTFPQEALTSGTPPSSPPLHPLFTLPPRDSFNLGLRPLRTPTSDIFEMKEKLITTRAGKSDPHKRHQTR